MAFNQGEQNNSEQESWNKKSFLMSRVFKMADDHAMNRFESAFVHFDYALKMSQFVLEDEVTEKLESDRILFNEKIKAIVNSNESEDKKKRLILEVKLDYMQTHNLAIFKAMPYMDLVTLPTEGEFNLTTFDLDQMKQLLRKHESPITQMKNMQEAVKPSEEEQEKDLTEE